MSVTGCVEGWPGRYDKDGYPVTNAGRKYRLVARLLYELFVAPIPPGLIVRHTCDNRKCINPWHIEPGTPRQNVDDRTARGRQRGGFPKQYDEQVIDLIRALPDSADSVHVAKTAWGVSKSHYYRIRNGEARRQP